MILAAVLLLLGQPATADLAHESRAVRDEAVRKLADGATPTAEIAALLGDSDDRVALGAADALKLRLDPSALPALARAAGAADATRGAAAAAALVATAGKARVAVASLAPGGSAAFEARLDEACREAARDALLALHDAPSIERPQAYRALLAGGGHAGRALLAFAADVSVPVKARAHALHAHARLTGEAPVAWLGDAELLLREAAAALVLRHGDAEALARLAARLEGTSPLRPYEIHCAALAVRATRRVGPAGALALADAVEDEEAPLAADAAAALLAVDPAAGGKALRARVLRHIEQAERAAGTGAEALYFELRAGPLPEDLRARLGAAGDPLLAACVAADPAAAIRPLLGRGAWLKERARVEVAARALRDAPAGDRLLFATGVLGSDVAAARRAGLEALRGAEPRAWAALRPLVEQALGDPEESVRLAAAALLAPEPAALAVCADALYDGDPASATRVALFLEVVGIPGCDPRAPVAERRRASLALKGRG